MLLFLSGEVESLRQQCVEYQQQVQQLQMYESMYRDTYQQMQTLNENTLPIKDSTIIELQNHNASQFGMLLSYWLTDRLTERLTDLV